MTTSSSSEAVELRVAAVARASTQAERSRVLDLLAAAGITGEVVELIRTGAAAPPRTDRADSSEEFVAPQSGVISVQIDSPRW